jgi:hypothetical protein
MADESLTTPGVVSRLSLFSAAASIPIAAAAGTPGFPGRTIRAVSARILTTV